jgi:hypothetical protein
MTLKATSTKLVTSGQALMVSVDVTGDSFCYCESEVVLFVTVGDEEDVGGFDSDYADYLARKHVSILTSFLPRRRWQVADDVVFVDARWTERKMTMTTSLTSTMTTLGRTRSFTTRL